MDSRPAPATPPSSGRPRPSLLSTPHAPMSERQQLARILQLELEAQRQPPPPPPPPDTASGPGADCGLGPASAPARSPPRTPLQVVNGRSHASSGAMASTPSSSSTPTSRRQPGATSTRSPGTPAEERVRKRLIRTNGKGETQLHRAAIKGSKKLTAQLLRLGADPNAADHAGWTPLHEASNRGHLDVVKLLVTHGADVNRYGGLYEERQTPLHEAARIGAIEIVRFLVRKGAHIAAKKENGRTPLDEAKLNLTPNPRIKEVIQYLTDHQENTGHYSDASMDESECSEDVSSACEDEDDHLARFLGITNTPGVQEALQALGATKERERKCTPEHKRTKQKKATAVAWSPPLSVKIDSKKKSENKNKKIRRPLEKFFTKEDASPTNEDRKIVSSVGERKRPVASSSKGKVRLTYGLEDQGARSSGSRTLTSRLGLVDPTLKRTSLASPSERSKKRSEGWIIPSETPTSDVDVDDDVDAYLQSAAANGNNGDTPPLSPTAPLGGRPQSENVNHIIRAGVDGKAAAEAAVDVEETDGTYKRQLEENDCVINGIRIGSLSSSEDPLTAATAAAAGAAATVGGAAAAATVVAAADTVGTAAAPPCSSLDEEHPGTIDKPRDPPKVPPLKIVLFGPGRREESLNVNLREEPNRTDAEAVAINTERQLLFDDTPDSREQGIRLCVDSVDGDRQEDSASEMDEAVFVKPDVPSSAVGRVTRSRPNQDSSTGEGDWSNTARETNEAESYYLFKKRRRKLCYRSSQQKSNSVANLPEPAAGLDPVPDRQSLPNDIDKYLNLRKQVEERRKKRLFPVQPNPPADFGNYLMNRRTYLLQGSSSEERLRQQMRPLRPPATLAPSLADLFVEQERQRLDLCMRHRVEREKLVLSVEQEMLRVHGRAEQMKANQTMPYSVCSFLRDKDVYSLVGQNKSDDVRATYNESMLDSWLRDVQDKWKTIKERMVLRHHNEAESLYAVQKMDWEWRLDELFSSSKCHDVKNACSISAASSSSTTTLTLTTSNTQMNDLHIPLVHVSDDFDLTDYRPPK